MDKPNKYTVILGRPNGNMTTLMIEWARSVVISGQEVVFVNIEDKPNKIADHNLATGEL